MSAAQPAPSAPGPLQIAVSGATGRMGRMLLDAVRNSEDLTLSGALVSDGNIAVGTDAYAYAGALADVVMTDQPGMALARSGCLIDFTRPEATLDYLDFCARHKVRMVIGTTGFDAAGKQAIQDASRHTAIVFAPNMSVGVNVTMMLLDAAAHQFAHGYDIEVIEAHHRHKVDAPSGTALQMGQVLAKATGRSLDDCAVYARQGVTGPRDPSSIGFATIRGGDIIGDHTVMFAGIGERIEISHKSSNRLAYADGSLRAARFLARHTSGLFNMQDVLGLKPL